MLLGGRLIALWFLAICLVLSNQDVLGGRLIALWFLVICLVLSNQDVTGWETDCLVVPCHMSSFFKSGCYWVGVLGGGPGGDLGREEVLRGGLRGCPGKGIQS